MLTLDEKLDMAEREAIDLFRQYDLFNKGWTFQIGETTEGTLGQCWYTKKEIILSYNYCEFCTDINKIINTVRHEVAHILAGPENGHNSVWKKYARLVGANPRATSVISNSVDVTQIRKAKYAIVFHDLNNQKLEFLLERKRIGRNLTGSEITGRPKTRDRLFYIDFEVYKRYYNNEISFKKAETYLRRV